MPTGNNFFTNGAVWHTISRTAHRIDRIDPSTSTGARTMPVIGTQGATVATVRDESRFNDSSPTADVNDFRYNWEDAASSMRVNGVVEMTEVLQNGGRPTSANTKITETGRTFIAAMRFHGIEINERYAFQFGAGLLSFAWAVVSQQRSRTRTNPQLVEYRRIIQQQNESAEHALRDYRENVKQLERLADAAEKWRDAEEPADKYKSFSKLMEALESVRPKPVTDIEPPVLPQEPATDVEPPAPNVARDAIAAVLESERIRDRVAGPQRRDPYGVVITAPRGYELLSED